MLAIRNPFPTFTDVDGSPLDNGSIYFGTVNGNPETSPQTVYWDLAATQPVAQPAKTQNGYIYRSGSPALVYAANDYSMTVRNAKGVLVAYAPSVALSLGTGTFTDLVATGNASLGDATTDTFTAGVTGIVKTADGHVGLGTAATGSFWLTVLSAIGNILSLGDGIRNFVVQVAAGNVYVGPTTTDALNLMTAGTTRLSLAAASNDLTAQGVALTRVKPATTSRNTTTTKTADPDLAFTNVPVGDYDLEMWAPLWVSSAGGGGFKGAFVAGGGATCTLTAIYLLNATFSAGLTFNGIGTDFAAVSVTSNASDVGAEWFFFKGKLHVTVAGTLSFQWAQFSSNAVNTNLGLGAYLKLTRAG